MFGIELSKSQESIYKEFINNSKVHVVGEIGSGKTFTAAYCALAWAFNHPNAKIFLCSNKKAHSNYIRNGLWRFIEVFIPYCDVGTTTEQLGRYGFEVKLPNGSQLKVTPRYSKKHSSECDTIIIDDNFDTYSTQELLEYSSNVPKFMVLQNVLFGMKLVAVGAQ